MLLVGFAASCGPLTDTLIPKQPAKTQNTSSEALIEQKNEQTSSALEVPSPIAFPPTYNDRPGQSAGSDTASLPNGLPALQPKGVNVDGLFTEKISDSNRRFERLENAVLGLRQEFESFKPAIVRLVAVESDIQDLIKQLDMLLQGESTAPPVPLVSEKNKLSQADKAAPVPKATPPPQSKIEPTPQNNNIAPESPPPKAVSASGGPVVRALRVGQHSDKTRLVIDASKKTSYSVDLDNQENLLIIEMPDARWTAPRQKSFARSSILKSYSVEDMNGGKGSRVILSLKKVTKVLKEQALPPGPNPNYRIFLDLSGS